MKRKLQRTDVFTAALLVAVMIWFFYFLAQIELMLRYYGATARPMDAIIQLAYAQNENLLFAIAFGLLFLPMSRSSWGRRIYFLLSLVLLMFLLLNQVFYATFFDHLQVNFNRVSNTSVLRMLDSMWSILKPEFFINLVYGVLAAIAIYWVVSVEKSRVIPVWCLKLRRGRVTYGLLAITYLGFGYYNTIDARNYVKHPVITWLGSLGSLTTPRDELILDPGVDLYELRYGDTRIDSSMRAPFQIPPTSNRPPNIIYFILESVGSLNILPNGSLDSLMTPNLHRLANRSVIYPRMYNTFPGSERTHIPLSTGGVTYTWGGSFEGKPYRYMGETLVGNLKHNGYRTGIFSAMYMDTENFLTIYEPLPWDKKFIPDLLPTAYNVTHQLNSWGIYEHEVAHQAISWIDEISDSQEPFYLNMLTMCTHHPYDVPESYPGPFPAEDDLLKFKNAIHYTDSVIGLIVDHLKAKNLFDETIIAITGDHGQAFGIRHEENYLHKNHLYEENIRNFLVLATPQLVERGPLVMPFNIGVGDVMPTLSAVAGMETGSQVPGRNLVNYNNDEEIHYFHKNSHPEKWGLVDGRWKYISEKIGGTNPELYDLDNDPLEIENLIGLYPDRKGQYDRLIANWYKRTNDLFVSLLENPEERDHDGVIAELGSEGPKILEFKSTDQAGNFEDLRNTIHPQETFVAWSKCVAFQSDTTLIYRWHSPSGEDFSNRVICRQGWTRIWVSPPAIGPLEEGIWRLSIWAGNQEALSSSFEVTRSAVLINPRDEDGNGRIIALNVAAHGIDNEELFLPQFHPEEQLSAVTRNVPFWEDQQLIYRWTSPTGKSFDRNFTHRKGWAVTHAYLGHDDPLEEGSWKLEIYDSDGVFMIETSFEISMEARLLRSYQE